jgi:lysozyme
VELSIMFAAIRAVISRRFAWRAAFAFVAAAVAIPALGYLWFLHYEPDRDRYPIRGIDVSHHQGRIDWANVAADDVAFVYMKASEGGDHRDRRFAENWLAARAAGIDVGAYHFFTFCRAGAEQAKNFLAVVPVEADALPPAVDLEFGGNCGRIPDGATMRRELEAFLAPVERAYGKEAVLYLTPEFFDAYRAHLPTRALWRRSLLRAPADAPAWLLWQYHNRGRVDGIRGPVDLNVFVADRIRYQAWKRGAMPSSKPAN